MSTTTHRDSLTDAQRAAYRKGRTRSQRYGTIPESWDRTGGLIECDYACAGYMDHACDRDMWELGGGYVFGDHACQHCTSADAEPDSLPDYRS